MQQCYTQSDGRLRSVVASVRQCAGLVADVRAADAGRGLMWHGRILVGSTRCCWCFLCGAQQGQDRGCGGTRCSEPSTAESYCTRPVSQVRIDCDCV